MSKPYPFVLRISFHAAFLYLSSHIFRSRQSNGLLQIALFLSAWMVVGVLTWFPVVKPLVDDVIHHPLSHLTGLSALFWMAYIYSYLSIGLSDMSGPTQLWAAARLGLFGLRVLILAASALRTTK